MRSELETPAPRGRPRKFDDETVLDALVQLFWQQGYESTSMTDIVAATGLNKSSLYSSFGSKDELFEQALNRYVDFRSSMMTKLMLEGTRGIDDLLMFIDFLWSEISEMDEHRGCLAVNTSTELGQRDAGVMDIGARYRRLLREGMGAALQRAANTGEIASERVDDYAAIMTSFVIGTAVIVRSGADDAEVLAQLDAARTVIEGWRTSA